MSAHFFETSARSAIGLVRQGNEDSAFASAQLIAVADGMGGHAAGEVASRIAVKVLEKLAPTLTAQEIDEDSVEDLLMHSLHSIDAEIAAVADEEIEKRGMGTTLTALLIRDNHIALLHVGDSRCYRLRGNTLEQLSNDHTVIQELLDQGAISQAEAADHPQRSMLTQALRGDGDVTPVLQMYEVKKGDRYLLCSDGLSGVLTDKEIKVGLGLSTGDMTVGDMGSKIRRAYTVMGDSVNLGARLEGITRYYGVGILVSEATQAASHGIVYREIDIVRVKGKDNPIRIYEPLALETDISNDTLTRLHEWQAVLVHFYAQAWKDAEHGLIVAHAVTDEATDNRSLQPMAEAACAALGAGPAPTGAAGAPHGVGLHPARAGGPGVQRSGSQRHIVTMRRCRRPAPRRT